VNYALSNEPKTNIVRCPKALQMGSKNAEQSFKV